MGLGHSLQGAPKWYSDYIENLIKELQQSYNQPYHSFRNVQREKNEANRREIDRLIELQKGKKTDVIPFSITGSSKPININPFALRDIAENENFARKVFESATGYSNISRDELQDLRKRAEQTFIPFRPQIERIERERGIRREESAPQSKERERERGISREEISPKSKEELVKLQSNIGELQSEERKLLDERTRILRENTKSKSDRNAKFYKQKNELVALNANLEEKLSKTKDPGLRKKISDDINLNKYSLSNIEGHILSEDYKKVSLLPVENKIKEVSEKIKQNRLQEQSHKLSQNRQPSAAAEEYRQPFESQHGEFSAAEGSDPEDIIKRASLEREINTLLGPQGRIAPRSPTYARAKGILERGIDDETMDLATNELIEAGKHDELSAVEPYVKASLEGPSDEYMNKYVDDYTKDIRKAMEDESAEEYLKKIAPKINMSFAQMGAFHSGARNKALADAANEQRVKLSRELAHLTGSTIDKRMEHHELQKRRQQSAGHLIGHTVKSQKEASQRQAELLRQNAVTKQLVSQGNAGALNQIAKEEQADEQQRIDAEAQEFKKQQLYKQEQLERQASIVSGIPQPASHTITSEFTPTPPPANFYNLGAGLAATGAAAIAKKEGGSVRKKYADGGSIGSHDIGNEIRNIIQEQNKAGQSHLEEVSNQNPMQSWLRHVGKEMLSNPREDPLLNLGRGTSNSLDHRDMMHERAKNLYDKIQSTKLNQYKVLAEYENMKDKLAFNREQLGETKRGHDIMREISLKRYNSVHNNPKKSSADKKMEDKALENIMENHEMKNDLILIDDAIKNSTLGTGPWIGRAKSFLGIDNEIDVLGNHIVTKANKLYGRGGGSNLQLKTLQAGKPGQYNSKKSNETIIKKYGQESDRRINKNVAYLLKSGWTPEEISTATGIQFPDGAPENAHNSNMESAQLSEDQNDPFSAWRPQE